MSAENQGQPSPSKKILESSPLSGIAVPIAIVLVGGLIIFGVTKMLSSGKDHRDLVEELNSKTFGNRWVAAYELSKFLAAQKIPKDDMPWVIDNLSTVYFETVDARTRNFVVMALGSLHDKQTLPVLNKALTDIDPQVKFNAVVSLGNMESADGIDMEGIEAAYQQNLDMGLKQVSLLTLAALKSPKTETLALEALNAEDRNIRYAAATILIHYKKKEILPILQEIAALTYDKAEAGALNGAQVEGLKTNILENIEKSGWNDLAAFVENWEKNDSNIRVQTKAKQALKVLKN